MLDMIPGYPKEIVLSTGPLGGLGDHFLYSTLPQRFAQEGHTVYFYEQNMARNDEILELLWGMNPFITRCECDRKKFVDETFSYHEPRCPTRTAPNAGYVKQGKFYDTVNTLPHGCSNEAMERAHGMPPPYSRSPKIYYKPRPYLHDLSSITLLDMHALSSSIDGQLGWAPFHQKMVDRFGARIAVLRFPPHLVRSIPQPEGVQSFLVSSIFQYVDMLAACRAFIGSEAGGQALAAAVRGEPDVFDRTARPEIVCLMASNTYNSKAFCFRGVDYHVSKWHGGADWLDPVEVAHYRYHETCSVTVMQKRAEYRQAMGLDAPWDDAIRAIAKIEDPRRKV